ncbi:hypothetical protein [Aminobacter aminovorans]|uniref:hypothetical protein n=1 Tax=Aminobacter aminovorans TaxID=83263 RepID=UPI00285C3C82|nr:hypothetical protein [Aminobacter aminovorans]MDR7224581.1 hypothetical protein [Aminobacter aminovorans]
MQPNEEQLPKAMTKAMNRIPDWFTHQLRGRPAVTMESFIDDKPQDISLMPASAFYWSMLTIVNADRLGIRAIVDGMDFDVIDDMKTRFGPEFAERAVEANCDVLIRGLRIGRRSFQEIVKRYPFYYPNGRRKLFTDADIEAIRRALREEEECRLNSSRPVPAKRRTIISGGRTSDNMWTRAQELLGKKSRNSFSKPQSNGSNVVSLKPARP